MTPFGKRRAREVTNTNTIFNYRFHTMIILRRKIPVFKRYTKYKIFQQLFDILFRSEIVNWMYLTRGWKNIPWFNLGLYSYDDITKYNFTKYERHLLRMYDIRYPIPDYKSLINLWKKSLFIAQLYYERNRLIFIFLRSDIMYTTTKHCSIFLIFWLLRGTRTYQ